VVEAEEASTLASSQVYALSATFSDPCNLTLAVFLSLLRVAECKAAALFKELHVSVVVGDVFQA